MTAPLIASMTSTLNAGRTSENFHARSRRLRSALKAWWASAGTSLISYRRIALNAGSDRVDGSGGATSSP